ncbi:MAG: hypothetical protein ABI988_12110 [Nitrospirota bacterium]
MTEASSDVGPLTAWSAAKRGARTVVNTYRASKHALKSPRTPHGWKYSRLSSSTSQFVGTTSMEHIPGQ